MSEPKRDTERSYPPDFVSAETLAYRLDCSRSTIDAYVRAGLLPKPEMIGSLPRWDFAAVVAHIKARNQMHANGIVADADDAYLKGIHRGTSA
jgi:predicted DNA-binding transcriptional regulator AlpA